MTDDTPKTPGKRDERDALQQAVNDLGDQEGQRPEPLRQFAQSAREGEDAPKELEAGAETSP